MNINMISIDNIGLSTRAKNVLHINGYNTVVDILTLDADILNTMRNIGNKTVNEILNKIQEYKTLADKYAENDVMSDEDFYDWAYNDGKSAVCNYYKEEKIHIDSLEAVSAPAYNALRFFGITEVHQLLNITNDELLKIPFMKPNYACEIERSLKYRVIKDKMMIFKKSQNAENDIDNDDSFETLLKNNREVIETYFSSNNDLISNYITDKRAQNALIKSGYTMMKELIFLDKDILSSLKNSGKRTTDIIISTVSEFLNKYKNQIIALVTGDLDALYTEEYICEALLAAYKDNPWRGFSFDEFIEVLNINVEVSERRIKKCIGKLINEKKLEYVDYRCFRVYKSFSDCIKECDSLDNKGREILTLRIQPLTLEEIGKRLNLTKERVRQIIVKSVATVRAWSVKHTGDNKFDEEYFSYFYSTYNIDKDSAEQWFGISEGCIKALEAFDLKPGKKELKLAIDDRRNLEPGMILKVKNYLNRNKVYVDGIWVEKKIPALERVVAEKCCKERVTEEQFREIYNSFLNDNYIDDENLYVSEATFRSRVNRLHDSDFMLHTFGREMRYYDLGSRDYTELIEELPLKEFDNIEISTQKLFDEHVYLMEKYDIRDKYELHNLLRKINIESIIPNLKMEKMPHMKFGEFDRDKALLDMIYAHAPISVDDLTEIIFNTYGYDKTVIKSTYLQPFGIYIHNSFVNVPEKVIDNEDIIKIKQLLTDDFYYLDEITDICSNAGIEVDWQMLKMAGMQVYSNYALQNYSSLVVYFRDLLTQKDVFDINSIRKRYTYIQIFASTYNNMKNNLEILEFEKNQIMSFDRLAKEGISKKDLYDFCDSVFDYVSDGEYFTIESIKQRGFQIDTKLSDLNFYDWFFANLLCTDDRFSFTKAFGNIIFYKGKDNITIKSFLTSIIVSCGSIDAFELCSELTDIYALEFEYKFDVKNKLTDSEIYYDDYLDRYYASEELYFSEI